MRAKCGGRGPPPPPRKNWAIFPKVKSAEGKNSFFNSDSMMLRASQSLFWTIKLYTVTFLVVL